MLNMVRLLVISNKALQSRDELSWLAALSRGEGRAHLTWLDKLQVIGDSPSQLSSAQIIQAKRSSPCHLFKQPNCEYLFLRQKTSILDSRLLVTLGLKLSAIAYTWPSRWHAGLTKALDNGMSIISLGALKGLDENKLDATLWLPLIPFSPPTLHKGRRYSSYLLDVFFPRDQAIHMAWKCKQPKCHDL